MIVDPVLSANPEYKALARDVAKGGSAWQLAEWLQAHDNPLEARLARSLRWAKPRRFRPLDKLGKWFESCGAIKCPEVFVCRWAQCVVLVRRPNASDRLIDWTQRCLDRQDWLGRDAEIVGIYLVRHRDWKFLDEMQPEAKYNLDLLFSQQAVDAVNAFTRAKMSEDGFFRRIMPPAQLVNEEIFGQL